MATPALTPKRVRNFKHLIEQRFFVRFHMALILAGVYLSGVIASWLLLHLGVRALLLRYTVAVLLAYGMFFLLIRTWLWYVLPAAALAGGCQRLRADNVLDVLPNGSSGGGGGSGRDLSFGGGRSGGGGASDLWSAPSDPPAIGGLAPPPGPPAGSMEYASSSDSSGSWGELVPDLGDVDDPKAFLVLIVFGILVAALAAIGGYLIYQAPHLLTDAAFQAALAGGLLGPARRVVNSTWAGGILKATWIPLVIVLALTSVLALVIADACPSATKLGDVFHSETCQTTVR